MLLSKCIAASKHFSPSLCAQRSCAHGDVSSSILDLNILGQGKAETWVLCETRNRNKIG